MVPPASAVTKVKFLAALLTHTPSATSDRGTQARSRVLAEARGDYRKPKHWYRSL